MSIMIKLANSKIMAIIKTLKQTKIVLCGNCSVRDDKVPNPVYHSKLLFCIRNSPCDILVLFLLL